jgi:hypothetical protein
MTCRVAAHVKHELDPENWWGAVDGEILDCLAAHGVMTVGDLCAEISVSEGEMIAFLAMLARQGRVRISQVELAA